MSTLFNENFSLQRWQKSLSYIFEIIPRYTEIIPVDNFPFSKPTFYSGISVICFVYIVYGVFYVNVLQYIVLLIYL